MAFRMPPGQRSSGGLSKKPQDKKPSEIYKKPSGKGLKSSIRFSPDTVTARLSPEQFSSRCEPAAPDLGNLNITGPKPSLFSPTTNSSPEVTGPSTFDRDSLQEIRGLSRSVEDYKKITSINLTKANSLDSASLKNVGNLSTVTPGVMSPGVKKKGLLRKPFNLPPIDLKPKETQKPKTKKLKKPMPLSIEIGDIDDVKVVSDQTKLLPEIKEVVRSSANQDKSFYTYLKLDDNSSLILLNSIKKDDKVLSEIGQGAEGRVRYAVYVNDSEPHEIQLDGITYKGRYVAVKKTKDIFSLGSNAKQGDQAAKEFSNATKENRLFDIAKIQTECAEVSEAILPVIKQFKITSKSKSYGVHPLMRGSLVDRDLVDNIFLKTPRLFADRIKELLRGIHAIHSKGYLHRDLSPDNILVTNEGKLMIGDFGAAKESLSDSINFKGKRQMLDDLIGTQIEDNFINEHSHKGYIYSEKIEVCSVGVCLFKALFDYRVTGWGSNIFDMQKHIKNIVNEYKGIEEVEEVSLVSNYDYVKDRLQTLIDVNGIDDVSKLVDFMDNFLVKDPDSRMTAEELIDSFCTLFPDLPESEGSVLLDLEPMYYPVDKELLETSFTKLDERS